VDFSFLVKENDKKIKFWKGGIKDIMNLIFKEEVKRSFLFSKSQGHNYLRSVLFSRGSKFLFPLKKYIIKKGWVI